MPRYCSKKFDLRSGGKTKSSKLWGRGIEQQDDFAYQADPQASKINKINETVLVREINKVIKKNKSRPIDTSKLLKNE